MTASIAMASWRSAARRALAYAWASPATAVGLVCAAAAACGGATVHAVDGTLEVAGGSVERFVARLPRFARFAAITLGHVVIGVDHRVLDVVRAHERVHVEQYERFGALFFPLYVASSALQLLRGRDPYRDNRFEREAFRRASPR